jgi:hypothetical protein
MMCECGANSALRPDSLHSPPGALSRSRASSRDDHRSFFFFEPPSLDPPFPLELPPRDALPLDDRLLRELDELLLDLADWLDRSLPFWIALPLEDALPRKLDEPLLGLGAWLDRTLPV